ncbi:MAG: PAS domain-containing protein [Syntrophobacterales bacterium]|jgi:two-component system nitrogen regulation sensor histidine kinase NtrY|nr:PAS domain-containing protein [Syntrophobacterales bacterium]
MKKLRKDLIFGGVIAFTCALLIYIETQLPFFKRFIPVGENKLIVIIFNINMLLILLFLYLLARAFIKTYLEKRRGIWGSGLRTKLITTLLCVSLIPSFTLFILATGFFNISMDKWFSQKIEDTVTNALELSNFYYNDLSIRYDRAGNLIARDISRNNLLDKTKDLDQFFKKNMMIHALGYMAIYDTSGEFIKGSAHIDREFKHRIANKAKYFVTGNVPMKAIIPMKRGELWVTGKKITDDGGDLRAILLIGGLINVHGTEKILEIASTHQEYKELRPLKKILKYGFIVPLSLITIMTIFFSVWVGTKMATEITIPIQKVKEGTSIIGKGRFDINLEDRGKDEIGTLVTAFNTMARELKVTKDEIEEKSRYIEVILDNVATGIISTDKKGGILFLNMAARNILGIEREVPAGMPIKEIFGDDYKPILKSFLKEMRETEGRSATQEMKLKLKKEVTYLRASITTLKDKTDKAEGFIVTFDDITHIVRAEKLATWREVARKLTHEIKNPLTPIMLSAERIRRKLLPHSQENEKIVLDETTSVIIRSAEDIKGIVNELTKLTHSSQTKTMEDINSVVDETVTLYRHLYQNIAFEVEKKNQIPPFKLDRDGMKRALINLITNSIKALDSTGGIIKVTTRHDAVGRTGIIEVADTGRGIPDEDKGRAFDPYFTKDKDGTGLGLAIVHSIILEHHGKIFVEDNVPCGAKFIIEIPIVES